MQAELGQLVHLLGAQTQQEGRTNGAEYQSSSVSAS